MKLTNNFHNTSATVLPKSDGAALYITPAQIRRVRSRLCGINGCTCGDVAGCRPRQVEDDPDKKRFYLIMN